MIRAFMGRFWGWIAAGAGAVIMALLAAMQFVARQRDKAQAKAEQEERRADTAEARIEQRQRADEASQQSKEQGDDDVRKATDRARSGKRDHFSK